MLKVLAAALVVAAVAAEPVNPTCPGVLILGVYKKNDSPGVSNKVVEDKIGVPSKLSWAHVGKSSFMCSDGRVNKPSLYTPGGDLGEFILATSSYEKMTQTKLPYAQVKDLMAKFVAKSARPKFGMCVSAAGAEAAEKMSGNQTISTDVAAEGMTGADMQGDLFLKQLLSRPDVYKTSVTTAKNCIKAFYALKFNGTNTKFELHTLTGVSEPKAVINVVTAKRCKDKGLGPLLKATPSGVDGIQAIFNSEGAVSVFRNELSNFFTDETSQVDSDDMRAKMKEQGVSQLSLYAQSFGAIAAYQADIK